MSSSHPLSSQPTSYSRLGFNVPYAYGTRKSAYKASAQNLVTANFGRVVKVLHQHLTERHTYANFLRVVVRYTMAVHARLTPPPSSRTNEPITAVAPPQEITACMSSVFLGTSLIVLTNEKNPEGRVPC